MSAEEEAVAAAEKILRGAEVNEAAGALINSLIAPTIAIIRDLVNGMVDATCEALPTFRNVGDEAGDAVAMAYMVQVIRTQPSFINGQALAYAVVELAKAKLEANRDQPKPA